MGKIDNAFRGFDTNSPTVIKNENKVICTRSTRKLKYNKINISLIPKRVINSTESTKYAQNKSNKNLHAPPIKLLCRQLLAEKKIIGIKNINPPARLSTTTVDSLSVRKAANRANTPALSNAAIFPVSSKTLESSPGAAGPIRIDIASTNGKKDTCLDLDINYAENDNSLTDSINRYLKEGGSALKIGDKYYNIKPHDFFDSFKEYITTKHVTAAEKQDSSRNFDSSSLEKSSRAISIGASTSRIIPHFPHQYIVNLAEKIKGTIDKTSHSIILKEIEINSILSNNNKIRRLIRKISRDIIHLHSLEPQAENINNPACCELCSNHAQYIEYYTKTVISNGHLTLKDLQTLEDISTKHVSAINEDTRLLNEDLIMLKEKN